jgi:NTE family protein
MVQWLNITLALLLASFAQLYAEVSTPAAPEGRVALVLAGGGARGLTHVGVIKALEEAGIPVDMVCGTSMGALVGGLWSLGWNATELDSLVRAIDWQGSFADTPSHNQLIGNARFLDRVPGFRLELAAGRLQPPAMIFRGNRVELLLNDLTLGAHGEQDFARLPRAFACVASDIETGEAVYLTEGSLPMAMRASMSLPSIFEPVRMNGRVLVDGGLVENLPTRLAKSLGADLIIAVNLPVHLKTVDEMSGYIDIADQSRQILSLAQEDAAADLADMVLLPDVSRFGLLEFDAVDTLIARGYQAGLDALPELRALLEKHGMSHGSCVIPMREQVPPELWLSEIRIEGDAPLDMDQAANMLGLSPGDTFRPREISLALRRFLASGMATRVGYEIAVDHTVPARNPLPARLDLHIDGPARTTVDIEPMYHEFDNLLLGLRIDWSNFNGPGNNIRFEGLLGGSTQLRLDSWHSRYHSIGFAHHPHAWYSGVDVRLRNESGRSIAQYAIYRYGVGYGMGVVLRKGARIEAGGELEWTRAVPEIADTSMTREKARVQMPYLKLEVDTRNRLDLPTRGLQLDADLRSVQDRGGLLDAGLRLDAVFQAWHPLRVSRQSEAMGHSRGMIVLDMGTRFARRLHGSLPPAYYFDLGGWPWMPGFEEGQRWLSDLETAYLGLRWWFGKNTSLMPVLARSSGNQVITADGEVTDLGWGIEIATRTYFGPLRLAFGQSDDGNSAAYLRFGWQRPSRTGRYTQFN